MPSPCGVRIRDACNRLRDDVIDGGIRSIQDHSHPDEKRYILSIPYTKQNINVKDGAPK